MSARLTRSRAARFALTLAVAVVATAFGAGSAFAASTYFGQTPGVGATSASARPLISVKVSDPAGISTGYQLKVDGVSRTPKVTWGANNAYCVLSYQQTTALKNGPHTVYASVFTGAGRTSTTWSFTTAAPPAITLLSPADGSTANSQRPNISAVVTPNGVALSSYSMKVDGQTVAATYSAATKTLSYTPIANLDNDARHTVEISATDATGATTALSWSFDVQIYADMADTSGCSDCHTGYPAPHPMNDCMACHDGDSPAPAYWNMEDLTPVHGAEMLEGYDCTYCHSSVFANIPKHADNVSGQHVTSDNMTGCSCHVRNLTVEHNRYVTAAGTAITCATCHASTDPQVIAGMATGSTACAGCHPGASRHAAVHETALTASCAGSGCHSGTGLTDVHPSGCDTCHKSVDPRVVAAIAEGTKDCVACHDAAAPHADMVAKHTASLGPNSVTVFQYHEDYGDRADMTMDCKLCHSTNIVKVHGDSCASCHVSGGPLGSFDTWEKGCQQGACHPTYHDDAGGIHAIADGGSCRCHGPNWFATPSDCTQCHTFVDEQAPVTQSNARSEYGGVATISLTAVDNPYGTGVAHTYYRVDGGARAEGTLVAVPGPANGIRTSSVEFWSVDQAGNVEDPQTVIFTVTTDGIAPTTTSDAQTSYTGGATIHLSPVDPAPSSDVAHTYYQLDGGEPQEGVVLSVYSGGSHTLGFWSVDGFGNVEAVNTVSFEIVLDTEAPVTVSDMPALMRTQPTITLTANDPGGSGVAGTYWRLDNGPVNDYPRFTIYGLRGAHTLEFWSVDNAGNEEAHTVMPIYIDWYSPVCTSDAQPSYEGSATIHLSATDDYPGGGVTIFWHLADGVERTGDTVQSWKPGTQKLWFWARDAAGNVGSLNIAEFTIVNGDMQVPTSAVDVTGTYVGPPRTVHLTAADEPGGSGLAATYYRVGSGETVQVDLPADIVISNPGWNTLYYWSVDRAGNAEFPKRAYLSITP